MKILNEFQKISLNDSHNPIRFDFVRNKFVNFTVIWIWSYEIELNQNEYHKYILLEFKKKVKINQKLYFLLILNIDYYYNKRKKNDL